MNPAFENPQHASSNQELHDFQPGELRAMPATSPPPAFEQSPGFKPMTAEQANFSVPVATTPLPQQVPQPQQRYERENCNNTPQQPQQMYQDHPRQNFSNAYQQPQQMFQEQPKQAFSNVTQAHQSQQQTPQVQNSPYRTTVPISNLGMASAPVDCPACGERLMTSTSYHAGNTAHAWAAAACCLTCILCFVPYLMNSMKDVQHRCGRCGVLLATWHKSGTVEQHMHA